MKLFKVLMLLTTVLSQGALADAGVVDSGGMGVALATWNRNTQTLEIIDEPAKSLYISLNADEKFDATYRSGAFAAKNHERFIKENEFANCVALKEKVVVGGDAVSMKIKSVTCYIAAPAGTTH